MESTRELQGEYAYDITLNDQVYSRGNVSPSTPLDREILHFSVADTLTSDLNR